MSQPAESTGEGGLNLDTTAILLIAGAGVVCLIVGAIAWPKVQKLMAAKKDKPEGTTTS